MLFSLHSPYSQNILLHCLHAIAPQHGGSKRCPPNVKATFVLMGCINIVDGLDCNQNPNL